MSSVVSSSHSLCRSPSSRAASSNKKSAISPYSASFELMRGPSVISCSCSGAAAIATIEPSLHVGSAPPDTGRLRTCRTLSSLSHFACFTSVLVFVRHTFKPMQPEIPLGVIARDAGVNHPGARPSLWRAWVAAHHVVFQRLFLADHSTGGRICRYPRIIVIDADQSITHPTHLARERSESFGGIFG